jgi:hypothetical protein
MADETPDPAIDLAQRVRELEEENARLSAASANVADAPSAPRRRLRRGWWRAPLSALCIVVAAILVPVSIIAAWTRAELVDEDRFVAMVGPLASQSSVQDLVVDETMTAIQQKVDFAQITGNVIDGITGLGLPPRASDALQLLKQPVADGLQGLVQNAVTTVVHSDAFANTWTAAVRGAHRVLSNAATSDGGGIVVLTEDGLGVKLGPIVDQVKAGLADRGVGAASLIPSIDKTVIVGSGDGLMAVRTVYGVAVAAGTWAPFVTLAIFVLGILLARRRSVAVVGTGVALAVGGASLAVGFVVGSLVVGTAAQNLDLSPTAFGVVYTALIADMQQTASVVAVLGVFVAVLGWALGGWSSARRLRSIVGGLNTSARTALAERGLDTGGFGAFLWRSRTLVRVAVIVLAVVWLLLLRPLSFGDIALVAIVALVIAWILELLQRRPEEAAAIAVGDAVVAAETADAADDEAALEEVVVDTVVVTADDASAPRTAKPAPGSGRGPAKGSARP